MASPFDYRFRVRADECDSLGHVNNTVYIRHLQQATFDALGTVDDDAFWSARKLAVQYHAPARNGDELSVATSVLDADHWLVVSGHEVMGCGKAVPIVSARIEWDCHDRSTRSPRRIPEHCLSLAQAGMRGPLKPFVLPRDNGALPFHWRHRVRLYELDISGRVGMAVYFNWLEEATYRAANVAGWPIERMQAENFIIFQYRHDAEFFEGASLGDEIEIVSRLTSVRRIRGTWIHEIIRPATETLLMRDYSTGAFLDWRGRIKPAPHGMMEALVQGEPTDSDRIPRR
jgi:YbgC/YbaW family acyl-CoA thioester hydrolase